jgi:hypothetical protein
MSRTTVHELQTHLSSYLNDSISLDDFRDWFDDETWGLAAEPDSPLRRMAGTIELRIAEFTNGHLSENDLRGFLRPLLTNSFSEQVETIDFQIPITEDEPVVVTFS